MANMAAKLTAAYMDSVNMKYDIVGDDGEAISAGFSLDNREPLRVIMHFDSDCESVKLVAYDLAKFPADRKDRMYKVCNDLNAKYRWIKFYVDEKDNTITAEDDAVIQIDSCAKETVQCCIQLVQIADEAYPEIQKAIWS